MSYGWPFQRFLIFNSLFFSEHCFCINLCKSVWYYTLQKGTFWVKHQLLFKYFIVLPHISESPSIKVKWIPIYVKSRDSIVLTTQALVANIQGQLITQFFKSLQPPVQTLVPSKHWRGWERDYPNWNDPRGCGERKNSNPHQGAP